MIERISMTRPANGYQSSVAPGARLIAPEADAAGIPISALIAAYPAYWV
jgi:hypothetical protein